jgi:glycosyltransferase involved in cell wall biosynthesis
MFARSNDIDARLVAILDNADDATTEMVKESDVKWDDIISLHEGDLGEVRNVAARRLSTKFISFLDGDDLCGKEWLTRSVDHWTRDQVENAVLHPEFVYYFDERDYSSHPEINHMRSFWFKHVGTSARGFIPEALYWNNIYTSNTFLLREFLVDNPLPKKCEQHGFGVEDWTWHQRTVLQGIPHQIVEGAVHLVRVTGAESLGSSNFRKGLLPDFEDHWKTMHR